MTVHTPESEKYEVHMDTKAGNLETGGEVSLTHLCAPTLTTSARAPVGYRPVQHSSLVGIVDQALPRRLLCLLLRLCERLRWQSHDW